MTIFLGIAVCIVIGGIFGHFDLELEKAKFGFYILLFGFGIATVLGGILLPQHPWSFAAAFAITAMAAFLVPRRENIQG